MKYMYMMVLIVGIMVNGIQAADCQNCAAEKNCETECKDFLETDTENDIKTDEQEKPKNLSDRLKDAIEQNKEDQETEKDRKKFELRYQFHDFLAKSERSLELSYTEALYSLKVIKPISRFMDSENTAVLDMKIHFFNLLGIGYVKNGQSENYDSLYVDILCFRFGKNIDGETGNMAYYGKYDRDQAEPKKFFFSVPEMEFQFGNTGFFKNNSITYEYNSQASVVGIRHYFDKNTTVDWKYTQASDYTDIAEDETGKIFRHSVGISYKF